MQISVLQRCANEDDSTSSITCWALCCMQAGLQLSSAQELSLLAARRTLLTSLARLANARSEILAALGMQLLQTHRV